MEYEDIEKEYSIRIDTYNFDNTKLPWSERFPKEEIQKLIEVMASVDEKELIFRFKDFVNLQGFVGF